MRCSSCKKNVTPTAPRTMWKIVNVVFWVATLAFAGTTGAIVGLSIVLAPLAIAMAMSIGATARWASSWTCPRCGAEMAAADTTKTAPTGIVRPHAPAWA